MKTQFLNRTEAGEFLAELLSTYANRDDVIVFALPRGGVPVAAEVAKKLNAPLDVFVVRKLGLPGHPELAMGAIASGGVRVFNGEVVNALRISDEVIDAVSADAEAASSVVCQSSPPSALKRCGLAEPSVSAPTSRPTTRPISFFAQVEASFIPTG